MSDVLENDVEDVRILTDKESFEEAARSTSTYNRSSEHKDSSATTSSSVKDSCCGSQKEKAESSSCESFDQVCNDRAQDYFNKMTNDGKAHPHGLTLLCLSLFSLFFPLLLPFSLYFSSKAMSAVNKGEYEIDKKVSLSYLISVWAVIILFVILGFMVIGKLLHYLILFLIFAF